MDLEMQLGKTVEDLQTCFGYCLTRLHGNQDMKGKFYKELMTSHVLAFLNIKLFERDVLCRMFQRFNVDKALEEMNPKERRIYYFLNC